MKKKLFAFLLILFVMLSAFSADEPWYSGKTLKEYKSDGLQNVSDSKLDAILGRYLGKTFNDAVFERMQKEISAVEGIDYIKANVFPLENGNALRLTIDYTELPVVSEVNFTGNKKVKTSDINSSLKTVAVGKFVDVSKISFKQIAVADVLSAYEGKGFDTVSVDVKWNLDNETNKVVLDISITEGTQTRVAGIFFDGNYSVSHSAIKKHLNQKTRSLFTNGFFNKDNIEKDKKAILDFYATMGFIDAKILDVTIEEAESRKEEYKEVNIIYQIDEDEQWFYGGMTLSGNKAFSDEDLEKFLLIPEGVLINMDDIHAQMEKISDEYYNNGYIGCKVGLEEKRIDSEHVVSFNVSLDEGVQSHVEKILITGLTKTEEDVFKREVTLKEGQIFSKADLVTSAQNIYNTGLLTDINYDIYFGEEENGVVVEFMVTEGNQMDIQFGATFGGNVDGFPVSGFLSWSNHNLFGKAKDISVSTNLSPDSQTLSFSFGDNWFRGKRWSNSFSFNFSHKKLEGELQKAPDSDYYDGRNSEKVYPAGTGSYSHWKETEGEYPSSRYLMDYRLLTFGLGYDTGYTFIWNPGRLSLNGGLSFSLNKAVYDDNKFTPFEKLTAKYHEKWRFSNKLILSTQWDGRDYIENTTKGYLLNTSFTYAGGILGGLSNYQKLSTSGSVYFRVLSTGMPGNERNLMFCFSSNASIMIPQLYNNDEDFEKKGFGFHDPHLGATKYEMLYIDGMTIARGHDIVYDQVFLWDNMVEFSYPLVKNVLNAEVFGSATALVKEYEDFDKGLNWYFSAGFGVKIKVSGFPLGFYLVKNGISKQDGTFSWSKGSIFNRNNSDNSGMKFVLAISTSLI